MNTITILILAGIIALFAGAAYYIFSKDRPNKNGGGLGNPNSNPNKN